MPEGRDTLTGYRTRRGDLLGVHNAKTIKGESLGVLTAIMYLAPHDLSGWNVCAASSADCRRDCLYSSGRGAMGKIQAARIARTKRLYTERPLFIRQLENEIEGLAIVAARHDMRLAVRLNGTSDILWERLAPQLFARFPDVSFYDYTKHTSTKRRALPSNYALTFSAQRDTLGDAMRALAVGWNVAAVVDQETHAALVNAPGFHDASAHDVRFLDPALSVGLLIAKGSLRKHTAQSSAMILHAVEAQALATSALFERERNARAA